MGEGPRRVLLVEDEALVAMLMEDLLHDLDWGEVVIAGRIDQAIEAAKSAAFDLAILDVNLAGTLTYPVADVLRERGIPFIFVTGYAAGGLTPGYAGCPTLQKPFRRGDLVAALSRLLEVRPD
jgi:CheY-like chemotaxis protein